MKQIGGFWWPDEDTQCAPVVLRDVERDVTGVLEHTEGRKRIIQAGGNVGVYAKALAEHFGYVLTVEPDYQNVECLMANLAGEGVFFMRAALGEKSGSGAVHRTPDNCGAHWMIEGDEVPIVTIDALADGWEACDAIWLDVEGYELFALKGAVKTINKFSPTIITEEKGLGEAFGVDREAVPDFLVGLGYSRVHRQGNDWIYKRGTQ